MFFTGTLQEGISKALQESKLVICFVTDNAEESRKWEDEYLTDDTIASSLDKDAVLLRLEAGSQEAGYLAAIFPLPQNPTLVIIKNGELKEYISAGTSREQFVSRVSGAFQAQAQTPTAATAQAEGASAAAAAASTEAPSDAPHQTPGQSTGTPASSASPPAAQQQQQPQSSMAALTHEAAARRDAVRKEREEVEKRQREKGKMKEERDPEKARQEDAKKKAAQQLAERQRKAREDRARVLKRIEDDKAERKARDEARRAERKAAEAEAAGDEAERVTGAAGEPAPASTARRQHDQCAIQVRLFDGSTIRTRLPAKATLAADVRRWIDGARGDGKTPYSFKVILTPLPNRTIDPATEEDQTLEELGLTPSSTLVLAPMDRLSSSAYQASNAGPTNPVSRLIAAILAFLGSILAGIAGAFTGSRHGGGSSDGNSQQASSEQQDRAQGQATGRDAGSANRIKGFNNPNDRQKDYQLYNGNSLNFEPRKDEEEKDK